MLSPKKIFGSLLGVVLVAYLADVLVSNYLRRRMAVDGWSPPWALRVITSANQSYSSDFENGFATRLDQLGGPTGGVANCEHAMLIDRELASGQKNGYVFTYKAKPSSGPPAKGCAESGASGFSVTADPIDPASGKESYFVDETGVMRFEKGKPATAKSPPIE